MSADDLSLPDRVVPALVLTALVAAVVFAANLLTSGLLRPAGGGVPTWSPTAGVALAVVVRAPRRWHAALLTGITAGLLVASLVSGSDAAAGSFLALATAMEIGITAALLPSRPASLPVLVNSRDAVQFVVAAASGVAAASALIALRCLTIGPADWSSTVTGFASAQGLGLLLLVPLLLAPTDRQSWQRLLAERRCNIEFAAGLTLAATGTLFEFWLWPDAPLLLAMVPLLWLAARVGPLRTMMGVLVVSLIATVGTSHGRGPIAATSAPSWRLAAFLTMVCLSALLLVLAEDARRLAVAGAQDAQLRFHAAFDGSAVGMWMAELDADGRPGAILAVNPALAALLEYRSDDLVGRPAVQLVDPGALPDSDGSTGFRPPEAHERWLRCADGRLVPCAQTATVVRPREGRPYVVFQDVDLTAVKTAETALLDAVDEQRRAGDRLRANDAAHAEVLAAVGDEMRTSLAVVDEALQMLTPSEQEADLVALAGRTVQETLTLLADVLAVAGAAPAPDPADPAELADPAAPGADRDPVAARDPAAA